MSYTDQQQKAHIREIQGMLRGISYYNPAIPRIMPDGIYGDATRDAVRDFQQYYGLRQTGEVNLATWQKTAEVLRELNGTTPEPLNVFPQTKGAVILPGDEGFPVMVIQLILHELSGKGGEIPNCRMTGVFDQATLRSLQPFQKLCGLPVMSSVDCRTWNMMTQVIEVLQ